MNILIIKKRYKMKNGLRFTTISLDEQVRIIGGEDTIPKPKKVTTNKPKSTVFVGDGNTIVIKFEIFNFKF
jgi:hypothetical protein